MKRLLIALAIASSAAIAAPTLAAAPYAVAPAAITFTIDGGAPIACTLRRPATAQRRRGTTARSG